MQETAKQFGGVILAMVAVVAVLTLLFGNIVISENQGLYAAVSNELKDDQEVKQLASATVFNDYVASTKSEVTGSVSAKINTTYDLSGLVIAGSKIKGVISGYRVYNAENNEIITVDNNKVSFDVPGLYVIESQINTSNDIVTSTTYIHVE